MKLENKKVLVTGADGFIGSHLVEVLVDKGAKVRALSFYNSYNYWGWLEDISCLDKIEVVTGDIRDPYFCKEITSDVEIIFHLAALISIPYSYIAPDSYIETNVKGTLNICQAALDNKCKKILHTSTSEVYGTALYVPIDEKHPLQPQSPYSASKIAADMIAESFYRTFDLPVTIVRPFNTYGPRQSARAIIPNIITQLATGRKRIRLGNLKPTRDFNYVVDTCKAFIMIAELDGVNGEVINVGSNSEVSIEDLFETIKKIMHSDAIIEIEEKRFRPEKSEVYRLRCDNNKLKRLTNFCPEYSLEEGLKKTVDWFTDPKNLNRYKPDIYNV